jgi:hypothetical protein
MPTNATAKKTADELLVDCEVAREVLGIFFAHCAKQLAEEKKAATPNPHKIAALESQLVKLHNQKMSLSVEEPASVDEMIYVYADLLKNV